MFLFFIQSCASHTTVSDPYMLHPVNDQRFTGEMCSTGRTFQIEAGYGIRRGLAVQRDAYNVRRCPGYNPVPEQTPEEEIEGGPYYLTTPNVRLYRKKHWKPFDHKREWKP